MRFHFCFYFFTWYFGTSIGITTSTIRLKTCAITAAIKMYKSIIKKKKKKYDKRVFLAKTKLNSIEVLISKALTDWYISHDEFVLVIDVLKKYDYIKEEIKNWKTYCALIEKKQKQKQTNYCLKCGKNTESKNPSVAKTMKRKTNAFIKICSVWH